MHFLYDIIYQQQLKSRDSNQMHAFKLDPVPGHVVKWLQFSFPSAA